MQPRHATSTDESYQSDKNQVFDKTDNPASATSNRTILRESIDISNFPRGAATTYRRKLEFLNSIERDSRTDSEALEGARLIINGTEVEVGKQGAIEHTNRTDISQSSRVKTLDDNNNSRSKKDGYADFVKRQSLERCIFSDDEIDYSLDLGRAAASQLWSSDSEESVDEALLDKLKEELNTFSNNKSPKQASTLERNSVDKTSKTAPIIETQNEPKKKVGGIRRLLSPALFSGEHKRKSADQGSSRTSTPVQDRSECNTKTVLETAFVGGDNRSYGRSKSVSPSRTNVRSPEVRSPTSGYGVPKTNVIRAKENGGKQYNYENGSKQYTYENGAPPNVKPDKNRNVPAERPTHLGPLQVDTNNRRDSVASSTSSSSTLVSPQENGPQWIRDVNRNVNNGYAKTMSLPGYRNPPQTPQVRSHIPVSQSGRVSAPPYVCCSPYGQINQDRLLMPVAAELKIAPLGKQPGQKTSPVSQQLRGLLSPQGLRPRGYDPYYYNHNHPSSVESSPGSQNSPKELRNYNPNVPHLVKPQPVYNSSPRRPRSVSPATGSSGSVPPEYFARGSNQRNTFSGGRPARQSTIYEEVIEEGKELKRDKNGTYGPIFKRGTLLSTTSSEGDLNTSAGKRVSFSPSHEQDVSQGEIYWPTRKGLAPEPPTRQSTTEYVNVAEVRGAPDRPLPPIPRRAGTGKPNVEYGVVGRQRAANTPTTQRVQSLAARWQQQADGPRPIPPTANRWHHQSDTESGSEAGEVQRILQQGENYYSEEEWTADGKAGRPNAPSETTGNGTTPREEESRRTGRGRRDDPRRHTLSGEHHHNYPTLARSMDLEMGSKSQRRKTPLPRGYPPPSTAMLFDDDPGIMSEVETSSTGFRRGGKQRSSLPVVRTPSKTLERPLAAGPPSRRPEVAGATLMYHGAPTHCGLVFLQYRSETKRALLPNEITSIDTVKALFVRSFPKQLTMEYLDSPLVKIYIHDSSKDMFYELEDLRSHLRDIRDRSVLRLFESADVGGGAMPPGIIPPQTWDQDQSYFSEPEFDSEYQHQHIHKTKVARIKGFGSKGGHGQPYYMTHSFPPGTSAATLPRSGPLLRAYSPAKPPGDAGYMSSPERGAGAPPRPYPAGYTPTPYEDPYYSQYGTRTGSITPVIDEEASDTELIDESYSLYGVKPPFPRGQFPAPAVPTPYDATSLLSRIRVEHMERQLANLTGLVQKALTQAPTPTPREFLNVPPGGTTNNYRNANDDYDKHSSSSSASLPDKSVSFEKSVSFSDEPPDMNSPKQHSPQHGVDSKPTKPAIKSSTLPRTSSQERDRHKPTPPPKPVSLSPGQYEGRHVYRDLQLTPEMYNQLRGLQKKAKDLRAEVRNLRRMSQAQAHAVRETIRDTFIKIRAMVMTGGEGLWSASTDAERVRISREEDLYKQEMIRLESDLTELEGTVEELRGNVINRKTRVNMSDVENMALILSKSSKTVADLKLRFPNLQETLRSALSQEMEKVVLEEKFLKEEPERLESALRRCKKLTGTLVTLKRLASVQEQRLPDARVSPTLEETPPVTPTTGKTTGAGDVMGSGGGSPASGRSDASRPENALDALLDELQTFAKPPAANTSTLRRLHSYPSSEGGKPPVPERGADLLSKRVPPPPPPRTSSRSPLSSPTGPVVPPRGPSGSPLRRNAPGRSSLKENTKDPPLASNSSSCESVNSQEGAHTQSRQEILEMRHQELLRKQKALQEQYTRLQQLQRAPPPDLLQLKKTGSESNILAKMGLGLSAAAPISGSLSHLGPPPPTTAANDASNTEATSTATNTSTTSKVYETDIL
ncbi:coiled-coil domain-containing protein AGAP005037 isoform X5 [Macrosteles quadrilineatus]|uniref:coiled-coil domain-containing protein AGAP005037 isoform X5 n=1 Tax=Macrosteles quadrilineatus TaxID=74068 RepID=UPI0023E2A492|nr:coiled-coil domain-containing protein AGAP005037 isoform X5 [Macrosteles quadrilineatus]